MINALGSNQCLQVLDISGNGMGDVGARLLAKALQINTRLRKIMLDRNNITLQGNRIPLIEFFVNFCFKANIIDNITSKRIYCKELGE